ncbi:MAG TPA: two-component sensor histidine kinase, partial [Streptomyces sp.]|nr:two-component sensor histidine kinase [Streptomyces sp.]
MRRRLIQSTLAVVLVVIAVFGISLVIVETRTIEESAQESVRSEAVRLVSVVESRRVAGEPVTAKTLRTTVDPDRYVRVRFPGHGPIVFGDKPEGDVIEAKQHGAHGETVVVQQSSGIVRDEVGQTILITLGVALLAIAAAAILAVRQAHR